MAEDAAGPGRCLENRTSLALLREQAQEMQLLTEQTAHLSVEMCNVKKVIPHLVEEGLDEQDPCKALPGVEVQQTKQAMSQTSWEDRMQVSDWALKSSGATIDRQRTSKSYEWEDNWLCGVCWFLSAANPPDTILQPDVSPGHCWPFQGSRGQVVIRLPAQIRPTAVTVQHILKASGTISSAPRDFTVSGVDAEGEEETLLGTFMYDEEKEAIQTFPLKNELPRAFQYIKLLIQSNWGNPEYTCIYRVQVHGKRANQN
ncbi:sperm-associated antigen 4 protein-like [Apteryx mantelli]|uniref:Sperm-associated antigen 4 protein-like n=4 Tax=Apteryx mantelli TaxID=2696672 RepID=A0ABM4EFC6_9AVES